VCSPRLCGESAEKWRELVAMNISVIIPVLNEEQSIHATLQSLIRLAPFEIIVVDGGSRDRTVEICKGFALNVVLAECGRARQMNVGARHASGDVLLFLHADTRLPASALNDIAAALSDSRYLGGRFDVELEGTHWML
jgi:glycosyltransferase involved in cell wall biosynthesis